MALVLIATALLAAGPVAIGVVSASEHAAVRSFSSEWVAPGGEITVTIAVNDYGPFGQVQETLPEGFAFLGTTLSEAAVGSTIGTMKFTLLGDEEFTYTARAPDEEGEYSFSGVLLDSFRNEEAIGGATILRVGAPATPTPPPTAMPTATPQPTQTPEPTLESTPERTPTAEPTAIPEPTATPGT